MTPSPKRRIAVAAIICLWTGSMAWLVLSEAFPGLLSFPSAGYRSFFDRGVMMMDQWMRITFQGRQIGYSHTSVDAMDGSGGRHYVIANRTILQMNVMGTAQRIGVNARAVVDALYRLQNFAFVLSSTGYALSVEGKRIRGNTFACQVKGPGTTREVTIDIPDDAVLYSPMTEMSLKSLPPGRSVTLRMFNPMTLSAQKVAIRSLRRESLLHNGTNMATTVLSAALEGMETLSWVDNDGNVLRQETLFGWAMEACTADQALALSRETPPEDMLRSLAVPATGPVERLHTAHSARLRLTGAELDPHTLETHRQHVVSTGAVTELIVRADVLPRAGERSAIDSAAVKDARLPSLFIQSDDPRLVARAREITHDCTNDLQTAMAVYAWVFTHVEKRPTVSLPSALDVLEKLQGDCNEHTYLFVGLARAAGIPARIRVGLTLHNGMFYYHAWPSVFVGRWLDMDPTLGQPAVAADHVSLFEGELSEQMKLMGVVGRLKVEVKEIDADTRGSP